MRRLWCLGLAPLVLTFIVGCGSGRYGYARQYEAWGDEGQYLEREEQLSYEDVRRFPDRHAEDLIGWFGTVDQMDELDPTTGRARLILRLRVHRERHLCSDETANSCRVTISERDIGPFVALLTVRPEDRIEGPERIWRGSLLKVYGHVTDAGSEETGPIIEVEWYRHWPHGNFVTTGAAGSMRR